jgi:hypothetical protein
VNLRPFDCSLSARAAGQQSERDFLKIPTIPRRGPSCSRAFSMYRGRNGDRFYTTHGTPALDRVQLAEDGGLIAKLKADTGALPETLYLATNILGVCLA